jgi:chemotaxis protein methyltransferase CheR
MSAVSFSDEEYDRLCRLLRESAGLVFDAARRDSVALCVAERMHATGCGEVAQYLSRLITPAGQPELQELLDEVTIPETHFFRNPPQMRALRRHVLPQLVHSARESGRPLHVWSAGCSTGEEPYTLAIMLRELVPPSSEIDIRILATDVSSRALDAARTARYGERSLQMAEPVDLARWFITPPDESSTYVVRDEVRSLVEFRRHNLVNDPPPIEPGQVDLLLCRNVTIYFDRDTTGALMKRFHGCLRDGGYLLLGHAETLWQLSDDFTLVNLADAFLYRRLDSLREVRRPAAPERPGTVVRIEPRRSPPPPRPVSTRPPEPRSPGVRRDALESVRGALTAGRYEEAIDLADEVITVTPLTAEAYYLRGLACTNLGRDREALASLRKAVYLDPAAGLAHFLLAGAFRRLGEPVAAARAYRAAAGALADRPPTALAHELGGRHPDDLAILCRLLAEQAEDAARSGT